MSDTKLAQSAVATAIAISIAHSATFNFRNWKAGQAGYDKISAQIGEGRITTSDVKVTKVEVEGKPEDRSADLYQRKPLVLPLSVPLVDSILVEGALTPAQADHLQALINAAVEKFHQPLTENGNVAPEDIKSWEYILDQPFKQRSAAVKVTEAMIKATNELFKAFLIEVGSKAKGVDLMTKLATKKFAIAACATTKVQVLEAIQGRLVGFVESLDAEAQHEHSPVLNLWATNLEKVVNPDTDEDIDEDMI